MHSLRDRPTRRLFVKGFALASLASALPGRRWTDWAVLESAAATAVPTGIVQISLTEFPALLSDLGSVRVGFNPIGLDDFPDGAFYPVIINRIAPGKFYVLNAECRHASCVVAAYDDLEGGLRCPCHLSLYGFDGSVIQGPTRRPLTPYDFTYDGGDLITIQVPGLRYSVTAKRVDPSSGPRLRLSFPTAANVSYEVRYRPTPVAAWTIVPFALSNDGALDQTVLIGDEQPAQVFVDRSSDAGFYQVSMQVLDLT